MLELNRNCYEEIIVRARRGAPQEVCGLLAGTHGGGASRATATFSAENVAEMSETRYAIDPPELVGILDRIEECGHDVVGFYHSHPRGPPEPSEADVERATWTGYSYLICALDGEATLGSWRWSGDEFEEEELRVVDEG